LLSENREEVLICNLIKTSPLFFTRRKLHPPGIGIKAIDADVATVSRVGQKIVLWVNDYPAHIKIVLTFFSLYGIVMITFMQLNRCCFLAHSVYYRVCKVCINSWQKPVSSYGASPVMCDHSCGCSTGEHVQLLPPTK